MEIIRQIRKEIRLVGSFMTGRFIGKYYGIMLFITVLSVITNLVFSYSFSVILSGSRNITVEGGLVLLVFAGGKLSCMVCRFLYSQISLQFKMRLKEQYLSRISGSLLSADYLWIVKQRGGDLIGKSCEDVNWCAEAVAVYVPKFFKSTGLIVFNTVFLSLFHPLFGAAFLLPVPVLFFSEWKGREICQRFLRQSTEVMSERNAVFQDIVSHHDLISHSAVQDKMLNRAEEVCERYAKRFGSSMGALVGYMSPAILLNKLPLILIGILGSVFISRGSIAAPAFLSAFLFTYAFNAELAELDDFMANFPTLAVFLERVKGIWDCPKQSYGNRNVFTETDKMIEFQNVSFRHADDPGKRMIFENVSFTAGRGEHVLLIGKNGCGKTTVLKLICGIYEHGEQGRITLCGYPPKDYTFSCLYRIAAYVPSEPVLWDGTVRDNLLCEKERTKEELSLALSAFDFFAAFPGRTEQEILDLPAENKGTNLSGGQRQRIGLARAWLSGAPVLLIDEATNSLDHEGEERIIRFLCASDRTVCMTTHHRELSQFFDKGIDMERREELLWKERCHEV